MFVYVYYLSTSQQPRHNEQVHSFTERGRPCPSSLTYTERAPLYKFTHLHRDGAPVQVYHLHRDGLLYKFTHLHRDGATVQVHSLTQRWRSCTSLSFTQRWAPVQVYHLHRDGTHVPVYSFTPRWRHCTSLLIYTMMALLYKFTHLQRWRPCTNLLIYTEMAPLYKFSHLHRDGATIQAQQ